MMLGFVLMRANRQVYWRWPVYSMMAMALAVVAWGLLRQHVLPAEWAVRHASVLYYGALAVYVLVGAGFGLLIGRFSRRRE
jgi:hypothetical protein